MCILDKKRGVKLFEVLKIIVWVRKNAVHIEIVYIICYNKSSSNNWENPK